MKTQSRILVLMFTDLADSTGLKGRLGDDAVGELIARHREHVIWLAEDNTGRIIDWAGDGCFLTFDTPSSAVLFALGLQEIHHDENDLPGVRVGIHMGEVTEKPGPDGTTPRVEGLAVDLAARIQGLALPGQVLMSSGSFNSARQRLFRNDMKREIQWVTHGPFKFKGFDDALEIGEAGIEGVSPMQVPEDADKAQRAVAPTEEDTLGWRPAAGQEIPGHDHWILERHLGVGGFGEVWLATHRHTHDGHVFKFCFQPERLRGLKREVVLFRLLRESLGNRDDIARVLDWELENPPYFVETEYSDGGDIKIWAESKGGIGEVPMEQRIELVRQSAEALQAAHSAGVLHKDVKPANILVNERQGKVQACLTDFGIGLLTDPDALKNKGITATGLTQTLVVGNSSSSTSGTGMYVAPELHEGKPPSERSDIYALGVLLYQMAAGDLHRALATGWERDIDDPMLREDIALCVDGNPENRLKSAGELAERLTQLPIRRAARSGQQRRATALRWVGALTVAGLVAIVAAGVFTQSANDRDEDARIRWARDEGLPEIRKLLAEEDHFAAYQLALEVEEVIPNDPTFEESIAAASGVMTVLTDPPGAEIAYRPYTSDPDAWIAIGQTPLENVRLPRGTFRWRLQLDGHVEREVVERVRHTNDVPPGALDPNQVMYPDAYTLIFLMLPENEVPKGMIPVDGGGFIQVLADQNLLPLKIEPFLIDRTEVTNEAYQAFVDAGGYQDPQYWQQEFLLEGAVVPWDEAMTRFTDTTGRPGPVDWELGRYPAGQGNYPVSGVSWYEAAAYSEFSGKRLPTIYHWSRAVFPRVEIVEAMSPLIIPGSNLNSDGLAPVGTHTSIGSSGVVDAGGNVREWCSTKQGENPYSVGGAWSDMEYNFSFPVPTSPWSRTDKNGFRCMQLLGEDRIPQIFARDFPPPAEIPDPVSDEVFEAYRRQFLYRPDPTRPLNARVEEERQHALGWRQEIVTLDTTYGEERVIVHLGIPVDTEPPYKLVMLSPGADSLLLTESNLGYFEVNGYFIQSGRALVFPILSDTYERGKGRGFARIFNPRTAPQMMKEWIDDFGRTIDYLETRAEFDTSDIAYLGLSLGTVVAPLLNGNEPRVRIGLYLAGGISPNLSSATPPEISAINYLPRHTIPTLLAAGRYDYIFPVDTTQKPFMDLMGTPPEHKRHVTFDSGHVPLPRAETIKETLDWLDKYQGLTEGH